MKKKKLQYEHKIGITAIIFLLIGIIVAFTYMYLNGNKITIVQNTTEKTYNNKKDNRYNKKSDTNRYKSKRYNIYNFYYEKGSNERRKEVIKTDTLPRGNTDNYYLIKKKDYKDLILDLNTCDTLDLQMIRGIGPAFARRISKYREKLGGYISVNQLKEVYGMDDKRYQSIKSHFKIANKNIRKININTMNIKEIASHPYIDYYLAKEIVVFRQNHGAFTDINQLKIIHLMDDATFAKISPYIEL